MRKLVAELREDKNGKLTKRWVKEASVTGGSSKPIPAPATQRKDTPRLNEIIAPLPNRTATIDPRTKEVLEELLRNSEGDPDQNAKLSANIMFMVGNIESYAGRTDLNNLAALAEPMHFARTTQAEFLNYLRGLTYENEFTGISDFLTEANPEQTKKAKAWVYAASRLDYPFTETLGGSDERYRDTDYEYDEETGDYIEVGEGEPYDDEEAEPEYVTFTDRKLSRLIMDFPDKVDQIVDDLTTQGIRDFGLIRDRILHPQQALRNGML